jgi:hypothetical protein
MRTYVLRLEGSIDLVDWDHTTCSGRNALYIIWRKGADFHIVNWVYISE